MIYLGSFLILMVVIEALLIIFYYMGTTSDHVSYSCSPYKRYNNSYKSIDEWV